jgi:hypothetical protein
MSSDAEAWTLYRIANAPMRTHPYPHLYVENVFPPEFYAALRAHWPDGGALRRLDELGRVPKNAYPERFVMPLDGSALEGMEGAQRAFWTGFGEWLLGLRFLEAMVGRFREDVDRRFAGRACDFGREALIVRDRTNYAIGPHTDAPHRLLSLLFYCPDDDRRSHLGTSIYMPKDPAFRCDGGPHYPHDRFRLVTTMEYRPNTLFAFFKTDHSFHGVEKIADPEVERDLLLYDIRVLKTPDHAAAPAPQAGLGLGLKLLKGLFGRRPERSTNQGE